MDRRNLLVHRYWEVDESQVYRILVEELEIFDEFAKTIADYAQVSIEKGE